MLDPAGALKVGKVPSKVRLGDRRRVAGRQRHAGSVCPGITPARRKSGRAPNGVAGDEWEKPERRMPGREPSQRRTGETRRDRREAVSPGQMNETPPMNRPTEVRRALTRAAPALAGRLEAVDTNDRQGHERNMGYGDKARAVGGVDYLIGEGRGQVYTRRVVSLIEAVARGRPVHRSAAAER